MFKYYKIPIWSSFPLSPSPSPTSTQIISLQNKIYMIMLKEEASSVFLLDLEEKKMTEIFSIENKICAVVNDNVDMIYFICVDNGIFSDYRYSVYKINISQ